MIDFFLLFGPLDTFIEHTMRRVNVPPLVGLTGVPV